MKKRSNHRSVEAFNRIADSLPDLSPDDRKRLRNLLSDPLVGDGSLDKVNIEPIDDKHHSILLLAAATHLRKHNGTRVPPSMSYLRRSSPRTARAVRKAEQTIRDQLSGMMNDEPSHNDMLAACHVYAELTIDNLQRLNIPITLRTLSNQAERFPALFDAAFPGYVQSGLMRWVLHPRERT